MRKALTITVAAFAALLLFAAPASAQNPYEGVTAGLTATPPNPAPGGDVTISGDGCEPNAEVTMTIDGEVVGSTTASDDGSFSETITAPAAAGQYLVNSVCGEVVLGVVLNVGDEAALPVTPAPATPGAPGAPGESALALTGSSSVLLASTGLALLAIGGMALVVVRSRSRVASASH